MSGLAIVASYLHRRVQPLKAREHFGFEYSGAEDPSHMVATTELSDGEVLARLQKILKGASVVPMIGFEYSASKPPPIVSFVFLACFLCF